MPGSGQGWAVGILNPHSHSEVIDVVDLRDESMATSGLGPDWSLYLVMGDTARTFGPALK